MKKLIDLAFEYWEFEINPKRSQKAKSTRFDALYNQVAVLDNKPLAQLIIDLSLFAVVTGVKKTNVRKAIEALEIDFNDK